MSDDTEQADQPVTASPSSAGAPDDDILSDGDFQKELKAMESTTDFSHEDLQEMEARDKRSAMAFAEEDITTMTDHALRVKAECLLECLHEYEILCLHGSDRSERARGRAAKDVLVQVCFEIGLRQLANRFKAIIIQHKAVYEANLKELKSEGEHEEGEKDQGRLSWWNL